MVRGPFRSIALILILSSGSATAAEFFVAPDGRPEAAGSREEPWDFASALAHPPAVKSGDTIWLRGGTYQGGFNCKLAGKPEQPIVIRGWPGERATIDCLAKDKKQASFFILGDWVRFQDLEFTCSNPKRIATHVGSWPVDLDRGSIDCRASHVSLVNLVIHDLGVGIGFWSDGEGGEIYGCIISNCGWRAADRGHGHGIYTQNARGTKRLVDNIIFNQFGYGIHAYGSEKARLEGFHIEGNALFNNGCLSAAGDRAPNLLVGGGSPASRIVIENNFTYHSELAGTSVQLGYGSPNKDVELRNNYLAGFVRMLPWDQPTVAENTFVGLTSLVELRATSEAALRKYDWDRNAYLSGEVQYTPLAATAADKPVANGWKEWQAIGLDRHGSYTPGRPKGTAAFVRPNRYEKGRATIVVYNWDRKASVEIDLKDVIRQGQAFEIVAAQDYFGEPILSGTYEGQPIALTTQPRKAAQPIGMPDYKLPTTEPEFGVFIVRLKRQ